MTDNLYLIDSNIYIYQAWHSLPKNIVNKNNEAANAVYGFGEFLLRLIEYENPYYMICAFDKKRTECVRKKIYPDYKSNRAATSTELTQQFSWCETVAKALGIACASSRRVEADDIIGNLSQMSRTQGVNNIILSADKDLAQFIGPDDILWDFNKKRRYTYRDIRKKYSLSPNQIPDMLALAGDKVDNIPGVPGVGVHTASRLLFKWGNLDTLYANLDSASEMKFRGARHAVKLIEEHKERVYLSRRLTGLIVDNSLPKAIEEFIRKPAVSDQLRELFIKLAFSTQRQQRWLKVLNKAKQKSENE